MMGILPPPQLNGIIDYMALAAGLTVGVAIFKPIADALEGTIARK
tara:strand:+ start:405 stop:539 length:135 start_codon:yes stop_codon:yes gene_type:complete